MHVGLLSPHSCALALLDSEARIPTALTSPRAVSCCWVTHRGEGEAWLSLWLLQQGDLSPLHVIPKGLGTSGCLVQTGECQVSCPPVKVHTQPPPRQHMLSLASRCPGLIARARTHCLSSHWALISYFTVMTFSHFHFRLG